MTRLSLVGALAYGASRLGWKSMTGRFSVSQPNMQNVPKAAHPRRAAFPPLRHGDRVEAVAGAFAGERGEVIRIMGSSSSPDITFIVALDGREEEVLFKRHSLRKLADVEILAEVGVAS